MYLKLNETNSIANLILVFAVRGITDVLLLASTNGKSDWILDSGSVYHLCRNRVMFSTYATCEGLVRMANNPAKRVVGKETFQFCMADRRSLTLTEVRYVLSLKKKKIH